MKYTESDLKTIAAAVVLVLVGVILLVVGANVSIEWLATLTYNVGSFIIASVVLALVWQYWQVRGFLRDMFREAKIAENLQRARITHFFTNFYDPVPWDELFAGSKSLDILFAYGATWRNAHQLHLERFIGPADATLNVVLPDPNAEVVVAELAQRFGYTNDDMKARIQGAVDFFRELSARTAGRIRVFYIARTLTFTFYRFSAGAVLTTYRHKQGRGPVLTFVCQREGELYGWIRDEWYGITESGVTAGMTKLVFDSRN